MSVLLTVYVLALHSYNRQHTRATFILIDPDGENIDESLAGNSEDELFDPETAPASEEEVEEEEVEEEEEEEEESEAETPLRSPPPPAPLSPASPEEPPATTVDVCKEWNDDDTPPGVGGPAIITLLPNRDKDVTSFCGMPPAANKNVTV